MTRTSPRITIFSAIVLEAFPFMMLGTLLGGFVEVFLSRDQLRRMWLRD